jgi:pimeloyl-ACP methyl ester carboxylesterase
MYSTTTRLNQSIILDDGRTLAYAEFGDLKGKTIFYFHGFPGSRMEANMLHQQASKHNIRIISVDRPGIGNSSFKKNREILDWPSDVSELSNKLDIPIFGVLGISAGASYALACAYKIHDRLVFASTIAALGKINFPHDCFRPDYRFFFKVGAYSSPIFKCIFWVKRARFLKNKKRCDKLCESIRKNMTYEDAKILNNEEIKKMVFTSQNEACKQGLKGLAYEGKLLGKEWNIPFEKIKPDLKLYLWHGKKDTISPVGATLELARLIPSAHIKIYSEEGHYSVGYNHAKEILATFSKNFY